MIQIAKWILGQFPITIPVKDKYYTAIVCTLTISRMIYHTEHTVLVKEQMSVAYGEEDFTAEEWEMHLEYLKWRKEQDKTCDTSRTK